jgi:hypothetical protein
MGRGIELVQINSPLTLTLLTLPVEDTSVCQYNDTSAAERDAIGALLCPFLITASVAIRCASRTVTSGQKSTIWIPRQTIANASRIASVHAMFLVVASPFWNLRRTIPAIFS